MSVTIRGVARESGVHISAVSRTFSASRLVNSETRGRVVACAVTILGLEYLYRNLVLKTP